MRGPRSDGPARPETPPVEAEAETLEAYLAAAGFEPEVETFVRTLARDGVAVIDLGPEANAVCAAAADQVERRFGPDVARVQDDWRAAPAVRALAAHPKILRFLEAAYGRRPFPFQTLNFRRGTQQPLHSDCIHFSSLPERYMCGVWIALEDIHPDSGPLTYRPGSHRLPILDMRAAGVNRGIATAEDYDRLYLPAIAAQVEHLPSREAVLRKGQAFVWAANLVHGGAPITDPVRTRRSQVTHYYFEGCRYYTPLLSDTADGALKLRLPTDIARGGWVWPRADGRPASLPWQALLDAAFQRLFRQPYLSN
ncbi:MAG: phytanoyl-CoA dioxygenase family protein [Phenylobacterium sp.]|uniref:phytanoyl-CoA dioxygenase family protein n=1 Tax=Phenylobacterium sp. TaxID=1871053 RepID=UPI00391C82AE